MLDLMEVPVGTEFHISNIEIGCASLRVTERNDALLSVEFLGVTTAGKPARVLRKPFRITPDLCERSFLDRDECRAYTAKRKLAKMYRDIEQARDEYLKIKSQAEKVISKVLEQNAELISKFPEMFL